MMLDAPAALHSRSCPDHFYVIVHRLYSFVLFGIYDIINLINCLHLYTASLAYIIANLSY